MSFGGGWLRPAAVATIALALAGCIGSAGIAPTGTTWEPTTVEPDTAFAAWPDTEWWRGYGDPALDGLVASALARSPDLELARVRVREAEAAMSFLRGGLLPQASLGAASEWRRYPEEGGYPPSLAGSHDTEHTLGLDLDWALDFFGRDRALVEAARSQAEAGAAAEHAVRLALAASVARTYFELARLNAERAVVADTREQRRRILELVRARVALGIDSKVELRQAEGAIPRVEGELAHLDEQIAIARSALARLVAVDPASLAGLAPLPAVLTPRPLPRDVPSDLLARRADITAARWRVEAALHGVDSVEAEFYPSVNLNAFASVTALGLSSLFDAGARTYGVAPALHLPIFDAGRLRAKLAFASAEVDAAVAQYNATLLAALHEVVSTLASIRALEARMAAQAAAEEAAASAYALALERYEAGLTGYLTVLATESELLELKRAGAALKARALVLDVDLNRALGGGYEVADPALDPGVRHAHR